MTNFEMVKEFHERFKQPISSIAKLPDAARRQLRDSLINEENSERMAAESDDDIVEIADALTDMLYVIYGTGAEYGIDLDKCFREVHASNMSKLDANGNPIFREDGKVLKGPGFFRPNLSKVIFEYPQPAMDS